MPESERAIIYDPPKQFDTNKQATIICTSYMNKSKMMNGLKKITQFFFLTHLLRNSNVRNKLFPVALAEISPLLSH